MTQQATARRGARPLAFLACALLALFAASCSINPWHAEALSKAARMNSIEEFGRDIEPTIIATRDELVTADTFMTYTDGDLIDSYTKNGAECYTFHSRLFFFSDVDTDHIRDTYNKHLLPLGFELSEKCWTSNGVELVNFLWTNAEYQAVMSSTTRLGQDTGTHYRAEELPSDGSTDSPKELIDQPGRIPDWFDPNLPPAGQG